MSVDKEDWIIAEDSTGYKRKHYKHYCDKCKSDRGYIPLHYSRKRQYSPDILCDKCSNGQCEICGIVLGYKNTSGRCKKHRTTPNSFSYCKVCNKTLKTGNTTGYCKPCYLQSPERKRKRATYHSIKWRKQHSRPEKQTFTKEQKKKIESEKRKERRKKNLLEIREKARNFDKQYRKRNLNYKIACNLRSRLRCVFSKNAKKVSAVKDLGCTVEEFIKYLEQKFTDGMTWENYGHGPGKWNIDHIVPLMGKGINISDPEVQRKLCHYTNLQPMWHLDNLAKLNKIGEEYGNELDAKID